MKLFLNDRVWFVVADWPRKNPEGEWLLHRELWRVGPFQSQEEAQADWERDFESNWYHSELLSQPKAVCYVELTVRTDGSLMQTKQVLA